MPFDAEDEDRGACARTSSTLRLSYIRLTQVNDLRPSRRHSYRSSSSFIGIIHSMTPDSPKARDFGRAGRKGQRAHNQRRRNFGSLCSRFVQTRPRFDAAVPLGATTATLVIGKEASNNVQWMSKHDL